jgi:hypothetical protein
MSFSLTGLRRRCYVSTDEDNFYGQLQTRIGKKLDTSQGPAIFTAEVLKEVANKVGIIAVLRGKAINLQKVGIGRKTPLKSPGSRWCGCC